MSFKPPSGLVRKESFKIWSRHNAEDKIYLIFCIMSISYSETFFSHLDLMEVWETNWLVYGLHRRNEGKVDRLENIGFKKFICLHEYISYLLYYVYIIFRNFLFSLDLMEVWKTNWLVYGLHRRNEGKVDRYIIMHYNGMTL